MIIQITAGLFSQKFMGDPNSEGGEGWGTGGRHEVNQAGEGKKDAEGTGGKQDWNQFMLDM